MVTCSVCIAHFNGIELIDACIESVRQQDCSFELEIIVHDDASSDGSVQHIRDVHPDVLLIESKENVGFCVANNRMAAIASGEFLLLLNNDAELLPGALQTLLGAARSDQGGSVLSLPQFDHATGALIDRGCQVDPFYNPVPNLHLEHGKVAMVIGACLWIPKEVWNALGGFPEWFGSIGEDLYLCMAARLAGYPVRVATESGYRHRVGYSFGGGRVSAGRLATTTRRRALSERNKTYALIVTAPATFLVVILPLHMALLHLEGLLLALLKLDAGIFRTIYAPLLPEIWRARARLFELRRKVQARRTISMRQFLAPVRWLPWKLSMLLRHGLPAVRRS